MTSDFWVFICKINVKCNKYQHFNKLFNIIQSMTKINNYSILVQEIFDSINWYIVFDDLNFLND